MIFTEEELKRVHGLTRDRKMLERSRQAGCFYCRRVFDAALVHQFSDSIKGLCPHCGIDSVIGDASEIELSSEFLTAMHNYWFRQGTDMDGKPWKSHDL